MDADNKEGMVGLSNGSICYLNFDENEGMLIKLVSRPAECPTLVQPVKYDQMNQKIFMAASGECNTKLKMFTSEHID